MPIDHVSVGWLAAGGLKNEFLSKNLSRAPKSEMDIMDTYLMGGGRGGGGWTAGICIAYLLYNIAYLTLWSAIPAPKCWLLTMPRRLTDGIGMATM